MGGYGTLRLYFAGGETKDYCTILDIAGVKRRLLSFYYMPKILLEGKFLMKDYYGKDKELFVDSGAYSAWTQGAEISIADYIAFLQLHNPPVYANLDDIADWKKTLENQRKMEAAGLNPLPVWHAKEPLQALKDYTGSYDYIGLGFGPLKSNAEKKETAKVVMNEFPKHKFHLFAITHLDMLAEHDFYSADSTGWVLRASKFATVDTPFGYVRFSTEHASSGQYYKQMTEKEKAMFEAYLSSMGFRLKDLEVTYKRSWIMRAFYQAKFFLLYEEACNRLERKGGKIKSKMLDSFFRERAKW